MINASLLLSPSLIRALRKLPVFKVSLALPLLLALLAAGCVTTEEKVFSGADTSREKAVESRVNLALSYLQKGDTENARRHLKEGLKIDPRSPSIHNASATVFNSEGETELAEEHFKKAISYDPEFSKARNNYAAFLYQQGRYKAAMKQLEVVVEDNLYEERVQAFLNMGRVAVKLNDLPRAESAFTRAIRMDKRYAPALLELALLSYEQKAYALSQKYYNKYRAGSKQSSRSLLLGIKLADVSRDGDARASYALALKNLYPKSAEYRSFASGKY